LSIIKDNNLKINVMKSNYDLVLEVIEMFEDENILNEFKNEFKIGHNFKKNEFVKFCEKVMKDNVNLYYIDLNWKYVRSGGDESVFEEE